MDEESSLPRRLGQTTNPIFRRIKFTAPRKSFVYAPAKMSKLLLIDDEEDVRYSIQRIFDSPGIELATASSGEEGLKVIA